MFKKALRALLLVTISLIISCIIGELFLRYSGFEPWQPAPRTEQEMYELDSVLGWKNKSGKYNVPAYHPDGKDFQMNFINHGQRSTRPDSLVVTGPEIVLVGGSYTQGWAINDNETFAWKLQTRFPLYNVINYGTAAYGTYQSLLVLEKELPRLTSPKIVLYGFFWHHEERNVATAYWLETLSRFSKSDQVAVPYASYDADKGLIRHPPDQYLELPFRRWLATIALVERVLMKYLTKERDSQREVVTGQVMLEMKNLTEKYGAQFIVVPLELDGYQKEHYITFMESNNIAWIDCSDKKWHAGRVPGDGHPNEETNSLWAECIASSLHDFLELPAFQDSKY